MLLQPPPIPYTRCDAITGLRKGGAETYTHCVVCEPSLLRGLYAPAFFCMLVCCIARLRLPVRQVPCCHLPSPTTAIKGNRTQSCRLVPSAAPYLVSQSYSQLKHVGLLQIRSRPCLSSHWAGCTIGTATPQHSPQQLGVRPARAHSHSAPGRPGSHERSHGLDPLARLLLLRLPPCVLEPPQPTARQVRCQAVRADRGGRTGGSRPPLMLLLLLLPSLLPLLHGAA